MTGYNGYYEKQLDNVKKRISEDLKLSGRNKELILKFHDECFSLGLHVRRVLKYMYCLKKITRLLDKDLDKTHKEDIKKLVTKIDRLDMSDWSKHDCKVMLKKFYKVMECDNEDYPNKVRWLKPKIPKNAKLPEDMLTVTEVRKLVEVASHMRDKAMISTLYEAGLRVGELLSMKIKSVEFDKQGCVIRVTGKTGPRRVRLITSTPYLSNWIEHHPNRGDPNSYLWVSVGTINHSKLVCYNTLRKLLIGLSRQCSIRKKVNPHNFRHSRATYLANHLTESQMKEYLGWTQSSKMASVYVHLSGRDVDNAILEMHGMKVDNRGKDENELEPIRCPKCEKLNEATANLCNRCGLPLNVKTAMESEEKEKKLLSLMNPETVDKMIDQRVREVLTEMLSGGLKLPVDSWRDSGPLNNAELLKPAEDPADLVNRHTGKYG